MNSKGQGALEYIMTFGRLLVVIAIVVGVVVFITTNESEPDTTSPAFKFCKAWVEENGFNLIDGRYGFYKSVNEKQVKCTYTALPEVFDGGVEYSEERHWKYFSITKEDLQEWVCK